MTALYELSSLCRNINTNKTRQCHQIFLLVRIRLESSKHLRIFTIIYSSLFLSPICLRRSHFCPCLSKECLILSDCLIAIIVVLALSISISFGYDSLFSLQIIKKRYNFAGFYGWPYGKLYKGFREKMAQVLNLSWTCTRNYHRRFKAIKGYMLRHVVLKTG